MSPPRLPDDFDQLEERSNFAEVRAALTQSDLSWPGGWLCMHCGYLSQLDWAHCSKCSRPRPSQNDNLVYAPINKRLPRSAYLAAGFLFGLFAAALVAANFA